MAATKHKNAYAVLGLNKAATTEEVKSAYVHLVKKYDPEKHTDRFMVVQAAFDKLRDPAKRAVEDVTTFNYIQGQYIFNPEEQPNATDAQVEQAIAMLQAKKADGSMPAADADHKLVQGYMIRSWKNVQKKLWNEAIADWQKVLAIDPSHRRAKNNLLFTLGTLGHTYATHELFDEATEVWSQASQMNPDDVSLLHNLAIGYELSGRLNDAARYWAETVKRWKAQMTREPDNDYLRNALIEALRSHGQGQPDAPHQPLASGAGGVARMIGDGGGGKSPASSAAASGQAAGPRRTGTKGIDDYREIIKLNPDDFESRYQVSSMLMKEQKWAEAIEELTTMKDKWPRNVEVLNLLGWALLNGGKVDPAFDMWRRAKTIEPKNHQITESLIKAHMTMGRTMRDKGLFTPCLVHFKALMRYLPDNDEVHFEIAKTYQAKGDERSAFQEYQKVLKFNPKHQGARTGLSSLKLRR